MLALASAGAAGGCTNIDLDPNAGWFSKPFDPLGRSAGFTFYEFKDTKQQRPIGRADLVDPSGACPSSPGAAPAPPPAPAPSTDNSAPTAAAAQPEMSGLLGHGVALGMSECDVIRRAGAASNVDVRNAPGGVRMTVLTFSGGPWPGIYHFRDGRLTEIERGAAPPPEAATPKKKPAKPAKKSNQA
jgi:hypothetical protein